MSRFDPDHPPVNNVIAEELILDYLSESLPNQATLVDQFLYPHGLER